MRRRIASLAAPIALALGLAGNPASAAGLDCSPPGTPHPEADATLAKAMPSVRPDGASSVALAAAIRHLRGEGLPRALIVDHAVAAYCPLVAGEGGLSPDGKRAAVRRFAALVTGLVYESLDPAQAETAILLTLPVAPSLSAQIDAASAKAGQTRDAWILQAIRDRLGGD